ncbi:unnamed protein product, partial [Ostreobium quekettii]
PYLLFSEAQLVNYLESAVMGPLFLLGYTICTSDNIANDNVEDFVQLKDTPAKKWLDFLIKRVGLPRNVVLRTVKDFASFRTLGWKWDVFDFLKSQALEARQRQHPLSDIEGDAAMEGQDDPMELGSEEEESAQLTDKVAELRVSGEGQDKGHDGNQNKREASTVVEPPQEGGFENWKAFKDRGDRWTKCRSDTELQDLVEWVEDCSPKDCGHARSAFVPWGPMELARFVTPRLGVDFGDDSGPTISQKAKEVSTLILHGNATRAETYAPIRERLTRWRLECVVVDPPFGLGKHSQADDPWDDRAWTSSEMRGVLNALKDAGLLPEETQAWSVAIYLKMEDIGRMVEELQ